MFRPCQPLSLLPGGLPCAAHREQADFGSAVLFGGGEECWATSIMCREAWGWTDKKGKKTLLTTPQPLNGSILLCKQNMQIYYVTPGKLTGFPYC